eukprot:280598-Rhodomonas_salina.2
MRERERERGGERREGGGSASWVSLGGDTREGFEEACLSLEEAISGRSSARAKSATRSRISRARCTGKALCFVLFLFDFAMFETPAFGYRLLRCPVLIRAIGLRTRCAARGTGAR